MSFRFAGVKKHPLGFAGVKMRHFSSQECKCTPLSSQESYKAVYNFENNSLVHEWNMYASTYDSILLTFGPVVYRS